MSPFFKAGKSLGIQQTATTKFNIVLIYHRLTVVLRPLKETYSENVHILCVVLLN